MSIKNFIKNFLLEQDDNVVIISPADYIELLENVGGVASRIAMLKQYRGKNIVIDGDLDLSKFKNVGPLSGITRVKGKLDISDTNVPTLDGITVDGYVSNYRSTMWRIQRQNELNKKMSKLDNYRNNGEWNVNNKDDESERTEALYEYLNDTNEVGVYEDDEGNEVEEDKYFIYPMGGGYYEWLGGNNPLIPNEYLVYNEDEADKAAKESIEQTIEDVGLDAFREWVWEGAIDTKYWGRWLYEMYDEMISDDPEAYNIPLGLSQRQEEQIEKLEKNIESLTNRLNDPNITDEIREELERKVESIQEIIEDINSEPEGDYDQGEIENKVNSEVKYYINDIKGFINEFGYEKGFILDFVDVDKIVDIIVRNDGYGGVLNSYDGNVDSYTINGTTYYVTRVN
jgi:hypothetical protein